MRNEELRMFRKILLGVIIICLVAGFATAQQHWWYTLERGKQYFRDGSFGDALVTFEDARRDRAAYFTRLEQDFILFLSDPNVRPLENSLDFIEMYIALNYEAAAAAALAELYHRFPRVELGDSALRALEELDRLKFYPEAEYWLGEAYRMEGELALALRHYERAFQQRALLENPGFEIEILYRIVEVHRFRQEYQEMDRRAREIIEGTGPDGTPRDMFWARTSTQTTSPMTQMRVAMTRILENEGINHFLTLYRHNNLISERAHRFLGFFYNATGRHLTAAEHLLFAFLIQNTVLIEEAIRHEFDFTYTTLEDLIVFINTRPALLAFTEDVEYHRTIFNLAISLHATGRTLPAMQLWTFLASNANAGEWGARARANPTPYIERALELP